MSEATERGRDAFGRQEWAVAYEQLCVADAAGSLQPPDLDLLAVTAILLGKDDESVEIRSRAYHTLVESADLVGAARAAFWIGFNLMHRGEHALGGGWLARAQRHVEEHGADCVVAGYLLVPIALMSINARDAATALTTFEQAAGIGERFGDADLITMATLGRAQATIWLGDTGAGLSLLDELLVVVTAGEASPIVCGIAYCGAIEACQEIMDVRRAQAWTGALTRWCDSQPDLVPFRGRCLVHRSEVMQMSGSWLEAVTQARKACELLATDMRPQWELGAALYQHGEMQRLRGEFDAAAESFGRASQLGREPQPGLALLRLARGQVEAAESSIRRLVDQATDRIIRARLLPAFVEIVLAVDDVAAARAASDELARLAGELDVPLLHAKADQARGSVALAEGDAKEAVAGLRDAWLIWQQLDVPYEAARARVQIGLAYRQLGDEDGAEMELDAARWMFQQLGAGPDLARVEALSGREAPKSVGGLTVREVEILRLLAEGKTNRAIAEQLVISQKTVARHVSNIFTKLGLSSRAAATAYAYQHDLV